MGDGFHGQVILGWPSNRAEIDQLNAGLQPHQRFTPTIEHSVSHCDSCPRGIWLGPTQRQLIGSPFVRARKLCLFCAGEVQRVLQLDPHTVDLNPDINAVQKRTA